MAQSQSSKTEFAKCKGCIKIMFWFLKLKSDGTPSVTTKVGLGLVTAAMISAAAFLGLVDDKGAPMTAQFEGEVLGNYVDVVGVETWCIGETQVGRLENGYTKEYCMDLFLSRYRDYSKRVYACYDGTAKRYVTPAMHSAFVDVFYNAGADCKSGMIRHLKAGNPVAACNNILEWKKAGGKDCSIRSNGCYGVWDRRVKVHVGCVSDAKRIPPGGLQ